MEKKRLDLSIVGYGKMGHIIEKVALNEGHSIVSRISKSDPDAHFQSVFSGSVANTDVCIEFSHPSQVIDNIKAMAALKKPMVIGTTGWDRHLEEVTRIVEKENIGLIYSPNFSIGVNFFYKILRYLAKGCNLLPQYDISCIEMHHNEKVDSPSGTAVKMSEIVLENISRKEKVLYGAPDEAISPSDLQMTSVRCGHIPGTHEVILDSKEDTIKLSHISRSRKGFAAGAIKAAEWIHNKKGIYTLDEMLKEWLKEAEWTL